MTPQGSPGMKHKYYHCTMDKFVGSAAQPQDWICLFQEPMQGQPPELTPGQIHPDFLKDLKSGKWDCWLLPHEITWWSSFCRNPTFDFFKDDLFQVPRAEFFPLEELALSSSRMTEITAADIPVPENKVQISDIAPLHLINEPDCCTVPDEVTTGTFVMVLPPEESPDQFWLAKITSVLKNKQYYVTWYVQKPDGRDPLAYVADHRSKKQTIDHESIILSGFQLNQNGHMKVAIERM
eukprot:TRINITY_DN6525_c0_g1_i1.p1 TRINITY_DN6525_c0_g1~~TRINITY_DN6525_c0_g1_i1.p1  ORF type:complete len:274 (-),score=60.55 TRINITY_DN6525_c0_g1_i1:85-795(-)